MNNTTEIIHKKSSSKYSNVVMPVRLFNGIFQLQILCNVEKYVSLGMIKDLARGVHSLFQCSVPLSS
jgi:hypothetical protein